MGCSPSSIIVGTFFLDSLISRLLSRIGKFVRFEATLPSENATRKEPKSHLHR